MEVNGEIIELDNEGYLIEPKNPTSGIEK